MTIRLLHPSRGRPQKAYNTYKKWMERAGHSELYVRHTLSLDISDPRVHEYGTFFKNEKSLVLKADNKSVVEATNRAATYGDEDILIYLSDDFSCPLNWAPLVIDEFKKYHGPALLKVDDCLQKFTTPVLTIPMINRAFLNATGYFWHPEYLSMHVDEDLYWTAVKLLALRTAAHLKFPHDHHSLGKCSNDETYKRSEANWNQGKATLAKRKAAGFPI